MRQIKEHEERRTEIIDTAQKLFSTRGYGQCSVNEILSEIGIAKGTFYHYFKSKEEVLDAIIERATAIIVNRAEAVAKNEALTPEDKLLHIFLSMGIENEMEDGLLDEMHKPENALMHQKSLSSVIIALTPILVNVLEEGIEKGVLHVEYPKQYMQIFLTSALTLLDDGIFQTEPTEQQLLFQALITLLCKMLNVEPELFMQKAACFWQNK